MKSTHTQTTILVLVALVGFSLGCNTGPSEEELKMAELQGQLTAINESYQELQTLRTDLETARTTVEEIEAVSERKRTDEQKAQLEELTAAIPEMEAKSEEVYGVVQDQLAGFLNVALNDYPQSPETAEALVIYSDEAIIVADEIVAKSGDYKKAINHLDGPRGYYKAIGVEVHPALELKIAELEEWRFINQERYDALEKGMTMDEVKATIGVPYYRNIQEDDKRGVETWLYQKKEGGAAAVYFKTKNKKMYSKKWDAIKTKVVTE